METVESDGSFSYEVDGRFAPRLKPAKGPKIEAIFAT